MNLGLDVQSCIARKNFTGTLSLEYQEDDDLIEIPYVKFASPVKAELCYEIFEDDAVALTGSVAFTLDGLCSRCLAEVTENFSGEVEARFVKGDGDGIDYGYRGGRLDFREALRDAVLAAMPLKLVCKEECELPEYNEE